MSSIRPKPYRDILWAPPRNLPFGLNSGGSVYNSPRWRDNVEELRFHQGIDLFARGEDDDRSIFSVAWGTVVEVTGQPGDITVLIRHRPYNSGEFTRYRHLGLSRVLAGNEVRAGERIGFDGGDYDHVHLEWRKLIDPSQDFYANGVFINTITLDPTPLLYFYDANLWPHAPYESGKKPERYSQDSYQKIKRIRILPWGRAWLFEVITEDSGDKFYLPVENGPPREELLVNVIRDAFNQRIRVKLKYRESFFYGERWMIDDVRIRP